MCIIISKKSGINFPSDDIIKNCFENNDDGAGIMFKRFNEKAVSIVKGIMRLTELQDTLKELNLDIKDSVVYHFRLATHGGKSQGNTHPFPITSNFAKMKELIQVTDLAMVHNGVIPIKTSQEDCSDTMEFIRSYVSEWKKKGSIFSKKSIEVMKNETGSSKYAFLDKKGTITLVGKGWINDKASGLMFSNSGYKERFYGSIGYLWESEEKYFGNATIGKNWSIRDKQTWKSKYKRPDYSGEGLTTDQYLEKLELEADIEEIKAVLWQHEGILTPEEEINLIAEMEYYEYRLDVLTGNAWPLEA